MATAYAIFEEEGEYSDHVKHLRAIALTSDVAAAEVRRQAEKFVEEEKKHIPHSKPIEILEHSTLCLTVQVGKMGYGPRQVQFSAEETPLVGQQ